MNLHKKLQYSFHWYLVLLLRYCTKSGSRYLCVFHANCMQNLGSGKLNQYFAKRYIPDKNLSCLKVYGLWQMCVANTNTPGVWTAAEA